MDPIAIREKANLLARDIRCAVAASDTNALLAALNRQGDFVRSYAAELGAGLKTEILKDLEEAILLARAVRSHCVTELQEQRQASVLLKAYRNYAR